LWTLKFLHEHKEFHTRYIKTVIARIYYTVNRSWSGRILIGELRKSNFLDVLESLEFEDDIKLVKDYFSYEYFYVIYCKFWELDKDHGLYISRGDLYRHNNYAISARVIDRIFSDTVLRGRDWRDNLMSYYDFVWFLISEVHQLASNIGSAYSTWTATVCLAFTSSSILQRADRADARASN
jgi:serine/threonine-protein phosphatase 2A regulatory subunit B''